MLRPGMPPPNCLPAVPLPSTRGAAALRQRPMPARGGQLQIAGVVVGSWGPNYGYQANQIRQPQLLNFQGRGRGVNYNTNQYQRRGQRKPGPPSYPVNKKNNVGMHYFS